MKTSETGIKYIKGFETLRLHAYVDDVGVWTIGWGHTGGVKRTDVATEQQAETFFQQDLQDAEDAVNSGVASGAIGLTQGMFDALVSFTFNLGVGALAHSRLIHLIRQREYILAAAEFPRWIYAGNHPDKGLLKRRLTEAMVFLTP